MTTHGHAVEIVEDDLEPERSNPHTFTFRQEYLLQVKRSMEECRRRELPGTYVRSSLC